MKAAPSSCRQTTRSNSGSSSTADKKGCKSPPGTPNTADTPSAFRYWTNTSIILAIWTLRSIQRGLPSPDSALHDLLDAVQLGGAVYRGALGHIDPESRPNAVSGEHLEPTTEPVEQAHHVRQPDTVARAQIGFRVRPHGSG